MLPHNFSSIGVEVGDIGPRFALESMNNGYLRFTNVRIPRDQMLMKYSQVDDTGQAWSF